MKASLLIVVVSEWQYLQMCSTTGWKSNVSLTSEMYNILRCKFNLAIIADKLGHAMFTSL